MQHTAETDDNSFANAESVSVNLLIRALWRTTCFAKPTFESNDAWCLLHFERVMSKPSVHAKYRRTRFARSACVSTWSQQGKWSQLGLNLVSTWSQPEKWSQLGLNLVSTRKVVSTWSQFGLNIGLNLVSTRERKNLRGLRRSESALNRQRFTKEETKTCDSTAAT